VGSSHVLSTCRHASSSTQYHTLLLKPRRRGTTNPLPHIVIAHFFSFFDELLVGVPGLHGSS
jgi:hypothetical protein